VIEVSGRTYPVEMRYRGPVERDTGKKLDADEEPDLDAALLAAVDELALLGPGDILVFLPGEREIRDAQEDLRKHHPPHTEILPLFGRLSVAEQERVFASHPGRRIVLATNVAETSLTVPGIRYVVDAGQARVKRYSVRNKIEQLKIEKISRASANQRAGRCGRVAAGVCIRLYDEQDYLSRPAYTTPELLRSSLAGVILRMKALRLPDIADFPFLDAPEPKRIRDGKQLLVELGALDEHERLSEIGRQLAKPAGRPAHRPDAGGGARQGLPARSPGARRLPLGAGPARPAHGKTGRRRPETPPLRRPELRFHLHPAPLAAHRRTERAPQVAEEIPRGPGRRLHLAAARARMARRARATDDAGEGTGVEGG
jgi:hypothetical protein